MTNNETIFTLMKDLKTSENTSPVGECSVKDQLIFIIIFGIIGMVCNFVGVMYLLSRGRSKCFVNLLTTMAFTDLIFLTLSTSLCFAFLTGPELTEE